MSDLTTTEATVLDDAWKLLDGPAGAPAAVHAVGPTQVLPSVYDVTGFATATVALATLALAELRSVRTGASIDGEVLVDRTHVAAAFRSERLLASIGWELPPIWDPIAGDYPTAEGWIRLHTNYLHHRDAVVRVLGVAPERDAVARAVATWHGDDLETAVVEAGGCAAVMRSPAAWRAHAQGRALAGEPLIAIAPAGAATPRFVPALDGVGTPPLTGVRVLDLTRVIAGPVCTRVLAAHGADVLRIDPPNFDEVGALLGDSTPGKRCAALDLRSEAGRARFDDLVAGADVLVHGYRSDALPRLGLDEATLRDRNPALVIATHDAYGWSGPWSTRRGFDSLVQMSCGIAARGREAAGTDEPFPLPAQALDHGTGYLLAATVARLLTTLVQDGVAGTGRLSLARTATGLLDVGETGDPQVPDLQADDVARFLDESDSELGRLRRVRVPCVLPGATPRYAHPAGPLGRHEPRW